MLSSKKGKQLCGIGIEINCQIVRYAAVEMSGVTASDSPDVNGEIFPIGPLEEDVTRNAWHWMEIFVR